MLDPKKILAEAMRQRASWEIRGTREEMPHLEEALGELLEETQRLQPDWNGTGDDLPWRLRSLGGMARGILEKLEREAE